MSGTAFDDLTQRLQAQLGVSLEQAQKIARANLPASEEVTVAPSVLAEQDGRAEKAQQNDIRKLWITLGGKVWDTSAVTRSKITPGIPDLYLTLPRWAFALWWESKSAEAVTRKDGGRSPAQMEFDAHVRSCGAAYGSGTFRDCVRYLLDRSTGKQLVELSAAIDKAGLASALESA